MGHKKSCGGCGSNTDCKCHEKKGCYTEGCEEKIDSNCVYYKINGGTSYLNCFLGISSKTTLQEILERLDSKLCNIFEFTLNSCSQSFLQLPEKVELNLLLNRLLDKLCNISDKFVKVTESDSTAGYLFDKVVLGDCLIKDVISTSSGQQLRIRIDYTCLSSKLPTCIEVDCCGGTNPSIFNIATNLTTICGTNTATLTATGCTGTVSWYFNNTLLQNTGTTIQVSNGGTYHAKCGTETSNTIDITNYGTCLTFTSTRTQYFSRNNCASTCTSSVVVFTKTYTSTASQVHADILKQDDYNNYVLEGQIYANTNGTCTNCNCIETSWNLTGQSRCNNNISQVEETSNCGTKRWVNGENACTCIPNGTYTCQTDNLDLALSFYNSCGTLENKFTWGNASTVCVGNNNTVTLATVEANNNSYNGYTFEYGIEAINNISQSIVYQSSPVFTNLLQNTNYKFKTRITKNNTSCAYSGVIITGTCTGGVTYTSTKTVTNSQMFSRNNCSSNCTTQAVSYEATSTQTRTSNVSQSEADTLATNAATLAVQQDIAANGQTYANTNGICNCPPNCVTPDFTLSQTNINDSSVQVNILGVSNGSSFKYTTGSTFTGDNTNCTTGNGLITNGSGTLTLTNLYSTQSRTITVRVYNSVSCNCYFDKTITVTNNVPYDNCPTFQFLNNISDCNGTTRDYSVTVNSLYPPYQWSTDGVNYVAGILGDPNNIFTATNQTFGTKTIFVKDSRGCSQSHSIVLDDCTICPAQPNNISVVVNQVNSNSVDLVLSADNAMSYKICNSTPYICANTNCIAGDGTFSNGTATVNYSIPSGTTVYMTVRFYNNPSDSCNCYTDYSLEVTNIPVSCIEAEVANINNSSNFSIDYYNCNNKFVSITIPAGDSTTICYRDGTTITKPSSITVTDTGNLC